MPVWFIDWWRLLGSTIIIFPAEIQIQYQKYKETNEVDWPLLQSLNFHRDFNNPWIMVWDYEFKRPSDEEPLEIHRVFRLKWWERFQLGYNPANPTTQASSSSNPIIQASSSSNPIIQASSSSSPTPTTNPEVLQRKTEEAALATKRLKEVAVMGLRFRRAMMTQELAKLKEEALMLKQNSLSSSSETVYPTMSPGAWNSRIFALENMLSTSSGTLFSMASQLSEAEERERVFSGRAR
ncbi:hypothetical protein Dimus_026674 [Dionaea muscipula]